MGCGLREAFSLVTIFFSVKRCESLYLWWYTFVFEMHLWKLYSLHILYSIKSTGDNRTFLLCLFPLSVPCQLSHWPPLSCQGRIVADIRQLKRGEIGMGPHIAKLGKVSCQAWTQGWNYPMKLCVIKFFEGMSGGFCQLRMVHRKVQEFLYSVRIFVQSIRWSCKR